jgi:predicted GNAT superfamily acetyltransferase
MKVPARSLTLRGRRFRLKVEDSALPADYLKFERLRNAVWACPEDTLAGCRNMTCENFLHEGSSLFLASYGEDAAGGLAEDDAHLVGFSYGFVGLKDKAEGYRSPENLWFYSQYTAVLPDYWGYGLGIMLKEFQRDVLMETLGIFTVVCTFDPLTAVNAHRNVHRFGMDVFEYRPAAYPEFGGLLNRMDVPADRFFMNWDLRRAVRHDALPLDGVRAVGDSQVVFDDRVNRISRGPGLCPGVHFHREGSPLDDLLAAGAGLVDAGDEVVRGRSGPVEMEKIREINPDGGREVVLIRIPRDFYSMLRETDVDDPEVRGIPVAWRTHTRTTFQALLAQGYRVVDFEFGGRPRPFPFYILRRKR